MLSLSLYCITSLTSLHHFSSATASSIFPLPSIHSLPSSTPPLPLLFLFSLLSSSSVPPLPSSASFSSSPPPSSSSSPPASSSPSFALFLSLSPPPLFQFLPHPFTHLLPPFPFLFSYPQAPGREIRKIV